jgi:hypothetical protein
MIKNIEKKTVVSFNVVGLAKRQSIINLALSRTDAASITEEPKNDVAEMTREVMAGMAQMPIFKKEPEITLIQLTEEEYLSFGRPTVGDTVEISIKKSDAQ